MSTNQVVVVSYPGRGHINPPLNLCQLLTSKLNQNNYNTTIFSVVVTEEWLGFLNPDPVQTNVRFLTIPNVLPSELNRGSNLVSFINAVYNKMEGPFEEMLDKMEVKVNLIIADATITAGSAVAGSIAAGSVGGRICCGRTELLVVVVDSREMK